MYGSDTYILFTNHVLNTFWVTCIGTNTEVDVSILLNIYPFYDRSSELCAVHSMVVDFIQLSLICINNYALYYYCTNNYESV